ncbi:NAD/NADP-dependent betaine aldehyde dehydrogenase [Chaetomidium leptoderma]|uniref:aldehyde dehydrogenase (NAD(+)) n=1 Tax=Chaetomidium leptoderma TaxID=669021 RepID=A0AAN6ZT78_9PEZI|nr:NAD/NADP-dependent betaine aldehyde dehydrogenase [Chaetomidium leptoderma]
MGTTAENYKLEDFETFYNVINNELTTTAETRHAVNPNTNEPLPAVPVSTQEDVDRAVAAARAAFPAWSRLSQDERAEYLLKLADAIDANQEGFAKLLGEEAGKPPQGAGLELFLTGVQIRGTVKHRLAEEKMEETDERLVTIRYVPLGVGVGIIPWNLPILLGSIKFSSALLTGNTFIWKPSPYTPNTALKVGELAAKIFPKGVINVLSGDESLGPLLTTHPDVNKISFTGSVPTGKKVMQACAGTLKRCTLELGGNDAAIIYPDVDIAEVVPKIAMFAFVHTGQICMAAKRIYVHEGIYDAFLTALSGFVQAALKTGKNDDPTAVLGPIQNSMQFGKLQDMYSQIDKQGWKAIPTPDLSSYSSATTPGAGFFLPPTLIDNPPDDSRIVTEEQFGPIVPLLRWSDEDDVVRRANASPFGLGGSVWSADAAKAERTARRLEAGTVWVNTHFELGPQAGFGGHKQSGVGVESGLDGLKGWCNAQAVWVRK